MNVRDKAFTHWLKTQPSSVIALGINMATWHAAWAAAVSAAAAVIEGLPETRPQAAAAIRALGLTEESPKGTVTFWQGDAQTLGELFQNVVDNLASQNTDIDLRRQRVHVYVLADSLGRAAAELHDVVGQAVAKSPPGPSRDALDRVASQLKRVAGFREHPLLTRSHGLGRKRTKRN